MTDHTYDNIFVTFFWIFFVTGLFFTWFFIHKARVKERQLLIEKGIDLSSLSKSGKFVINFRFPWLKIGVIFICIPIGFLIGNALIPLFDRRISDILPVIFVFLFGGIGMVLNHFLDKPKAQQ